MTARNSKLATHGGGARRAFSLAELLVVVGIVSLLIAIILPPLQFARRKAMQTKCAAQLQQLGRALEAAYNEYGFYPYWDDGGRTIRYTWIDVLIQQQFLGSTNGSTGPDRRRRGASGVGYCPSDMLPDPLNASRHNHLIYPPNHNHSGVDYSYGIGAPLSAGGWAWRVSGSDQRPRRFRGHERDTSGRVLAGDAFASAIFNLSGQALQSGVWNSPTQFDNTVAWGRHPASTPNAASANLLFQDGHVDAVDYRFARELPVNTSRVFVWRPGEPINVGPNDQLEDDWYPLRPHPGLHDDPVSMSFPKEMAPGWYTQAGRWTRISHK